MLKALLDTIFPPLCHACKAYLTDPETLHLCTQCMQKVEPISSPLCTICGAPFATEGGADHKCGRCSEAPPPFAAARAAVVYDGVVQELIHTFKYDLKVQLRLPLALLTLRLLTPFIQTKNPDLVLPVPLHSKRLRARGFNQALLLGEKMAKEWNIPLSRRNLLRTRWTEPQIHLAAADRIANVRGAFALAHPEEIGNRRIVLIDDVYTTGSTAAECAKTLMLAGAKEVVVVTVARALS